MEVRYCQPFVRGNRSIRGKVLSVPEFPIICRQHYGHFERETIVAASKFSGPHRARLEFQHQKRRKLRATLIKEYERKERRKWSENIVNRLENSFSEDVQEGTWSYASSGSSSAIDHRYRHDLEDDIQCAIFWDIENVWNEYSSSYHCALILAQYPPSSYCDRSHSRLCTLSSYPGLPSLHVPARITHRSPYPRYLFPAWSHIHPLL
jgi:hypothetical protein